MISYWLEMKKNSDFSQDLALSFPAKAEVKPQNKKL